MKEPVYLIDVTCLADNPFPGGAVAFNQILQIFHMPPSTLLAACETTAICFSNKENRPKRAIFRIRYENIRFWISLGKQSPARNFLIFSFRHLPFWRGGPQSPRLVPAARGNWSPLIRYRVVTSTAAPTHYGAGHPAITLMQKPSISVKVALSSPPIAPISILAGVSSGRDIR